MSFSVVRKGSCTPPQPRECYGVAFSSGLYPCQARAVLPNIVLLRLPRCAGSCGAVGAHPHPADGHCRGAHAATALKHCCADHQRFRTCCRCCCCCCCSCLCVQVPAAQWEHTPIQLMATAGVRMLRNGSAERIMAEVRVCVWGGCFVNVLLG